MHEERTCWADTLAAEFAAVREQASDGILDSGWKGAEIIRLREQVRALRKALGEVCGTFAPRLPNSVVKTNYKNFAPRFGFAWRPLGRTVVRGGYGIFFGSDSVYRYDELSNVYPFSILTTFSASTSNPLLLTVSNPIPARRS